MRSILFLTAFLTTSAFSVPTPFWQGTSGGFEVQWNSEAIKVTDTKDKKNSYLVISNKTPSSADEDQSASFYTIQSLVGPFTSLKTKFVAQLAPDASTEVFLEYKLMQLRDATKAISLTEIFPAAEIYDALLKDKVVKSAIPKSKSKNLKDLQSLVAFLKNKEIESTTDDETNQFPSDLLTAVSFHHLEGDRVAVRIHLPPTRPKFGKEKALGILLKIPAAMTEDFKAASEGKKGFLMKNAPLDENKQPFETRNPST